MTESIVETYKFNDFINFLSKKTTLRNHSRSYTDFNYCQESWNDAVHNARFGVKLQEDIKKIVTNMSMLEHVKTKGFCIDEHGLCFDVGAYLSGEPECWINENFNYQPKKVVKILINATLGSYNGTQTVQNRGAGIISLIQMLKKQGYIVIVNLYFSSYTTNAGYDMFSFINHQNVAHLKEYTLFIKVCANPLDIQSLSYAVCSPSFCRRFYLAWLEYQENHHHPASYGYVRSLNQESISKDIIHFTGIDTEGCSYYDIKQTKEYVLDIFNKFLELNHEVKKNED